MASVGYMLLQSDNSVKYFNWSPTWDCVWSQHASNAIHFDFERDGLDWGNAAYTFVIPKGLNTTPATSLVKVGNQFEAW